jgi:hypothetical protein
VKITVSKSMTIPQALEITLKELKWELHSVGARQDEYVLFGSTPLIMRGIIDREPGDVDIFVTRRVWGALLGRAGWEVETPAAGDPPILVFQPMLGIPAVNAFFDWTKSKPHVNVERCFATATEVDGWMCASTEEILIHKEEATERVEKHLADIEAIRKEANGNH